jgi:D-amino-acid oxidase
LIRRPYASINSLLADLPATSLLINATGIGSLNLTDIRDTNLYPTRGQTLLIAEPKTPINRMYEYERTNKYEDTIFFELTFCTLASSSPSKKMC